MKRIFGLIVSAIALVLMHTRIALADLAPIEDEIISEGDKPIGLVILVIAIAVAATGILLNRKGSK